jgi:hypothetical protein
MNIEKNEYADIGTQFTLKADKEAVTQCILQENFDICLRGHTQDWHGAAV